MKTLVKGFLYAFKKPISMLSFSSAFYKAAFDKAFMISLALIAVDKPIVGF